MTAQTFSEWIDRQLHRRRWLWSDLCREAGIDTGTLTNALKRSVGPSLARSIAHALEIPEWQVFMQVGILTEAPIMLDMMPTQSKPRTCWQPCQLMTGRSWLLGAEKK
jgi:lambda repressor-like predicted transcriptional regulator